MKSKQQEIDQFLAFQKRVEKDGYLAGILAGMESYVQNQIQNDTAIPIITWVNMNEKRVMEAETAAIEARKKLACRDREIEQAHKLIEMGRITIEEQGGIIERLKAEFDDAESKLSDALVEGRKNRQELIELKAAKYDELMAAKKS
jgi:hypothetical protein